MIRHYKFPLNLDVMPKPLPLWVRLRIRYHVARWKFFLWLSKVPRWGAKADPEMEIILFFAILDAALAGACAYLVS